MSSILVLWFSNFLYAKGNKNWVDGEILVKIKNLPGLGKRTAPEKFLQQKLADAFPKFQGIQIMPVLHRAENTPLENVFLVRFQPANASAQFLKALETDTDFEYVQLNHILQIDQSSINDSLFSSQWGLEAVRASEAWQITAGSPEVPIAVIDTGIDYDHPDLGGQIWINSAEDLNQNGRVDSTDFNGIDDDHNGFVDDIQGWDFTDAPTFVDAGDYLDRDNNPMDENGHGTAVAGIIAAKEGNKMGIAGLAFGSRIMNLRAGTSLGFLEEDDVAAAIIYAVNNGARIMNMSFGDIVVSPMLRDVIRFAYARGVVIVASSGNSGSEEPHYPSGFSETISVGAVTKTKALAGFSNFGSTLDVVAPGQEIWTTRLGGDYQTFAGTSAAAPFVSALAGLLLAKNPDWGVEQVRSVMITSAIDLGKKGWDRYFGGGLIDAFRALQIKEASVAKLNKPEMDSGLADGEVAVLGTASGAFLQKYTLSFGVGNAPESWQEIQTVENRQVVKDTLAFWDLSRLVDTTYTLRLQVVNQNGFTIEDQNRIYLDRTPPNISRVQMNPMIDGDHYSALISFKVDDLSRATLFWRKSGSNEDFQKIPLNYVTQEHRFNFSEKRSGNANVEFFLEAKNRSGLIGLDDNHGNYFHIEFNATPVSFQQLNEFATELPPGILMNHLVDINLNRQKEIALSLYEPDGTIGKMAIFEWSSAGFRQKMITPNRAIPRDVGDSDGDDLVEILAGLGPASFIYEATNEGQFPSRIVWIDTSNFWASRFADLDGDGKTEIIGRRGDLWQVLENTGDNQFTFIDSLPNPTLGTNITGVPHTEVGDFDGDGKMEILFGDYDGEVYIYEAEGDNLFRWTWADSLPLLDTIDFIKAGDFNGDGTTDFAVACHSDPALNKEHEFDARHWLVRIYVGAGDNKFDVAWEQRFFGFFPPRDFDSGLGSGDLDGDGADELVISVFPDLYLVQDDPTTGQFRTTWHFRGAKSNTALIGKLGDGQSALLFNDGEKITKFALAQSDSRPAAPLNLDGYPLGMRRVQLSWRQVVNADYYSIYRGLSADQLQALGSVFKTSFVDTTVKEGNTYFYAVTAVDLHREPGESALSRVIQITPGPGPKLFSATYLSPGHVSLLFSEPLGETAMNAANYAIDSVGHPTSVALGRGGIEALLTLPNVPPGKYQVRVSHITDLDRTPLDPDFQEAYFEVLPEQERFYLITAELLSEYKIRLLFNQPVESTLAADTSYYRLSAPLQLATAQVDESDPYAVILQLSPRGRIAPLGKDYQVVIQGLSSQTGVLIRKGEGDAAGFSLASEALGHVFAYPNPFVLGRQPYVMIAGLPRVAEIRILDIFGRLVRQLQEVDGNGGTPWDGRDENGSEVPGGIYLIYVTTGTGQKTMAKVAVVR